VLANQSKGVRKATRAVNRHQEQRRQNEEAHARDKADLQMFKERRDALNKETQRLLRQEGRLEERLAALPSPGEHYDVVVKRLEDENAHRDATIAKLEKALVEEQQQQPESASASAVVAAPEQSSNDELEQLRAEYLRLTEQLKR